MSLIKRLWRDDAGFVVSMELVMVATIAVLGLVVGMTAIRDATISELSDVAGAFQDLNQSYVWRGVQGHSAATSGSDYTDQLDYCDSVDDPTGVMDNCIVTVTSNDEGSNQAAPSL